MEAVSMIDSLWLMLTSWGSPVANSGRAWRACLRGNGALDLIGPFIVEARHPSNHRARNRHSSKTIAERLVILKALPPTKDVWAVATF